MRVNVWINDQLATRAKAKRINISALLRGALEEVLRDEGETAERVPVSAYRVGDEIVIRIRDPDRPSL
jgi:hypothetical protein